MTRCETAENEPERPFQMLGITSESEKAIWADRFCLTAPAPRSYFAGPPPSGCGGNEATSAIPCGTIVDSGHLPGDGRWINPGGELRLVGGMLWH